MDYFSIDSTNNELFVLFHGTDGNEYSLLQIAGDINPHAHILSFIGDVDSHASRRIFAPLQNGQLQRADFNKRVDAFLAQWAEMPPHNGPITFIGYSNGANFILSLLEKAPTIAARVILMHPSDLHYTFSTGSDAQIFITTGARDTLAPAGQVLTLEKQLRAHFPKTTLQLLDGAHELSDEEITYLQHVIQPLL